MPNKLAFLTIENINKSYISTKYPNEATITKKTTFLLVRVDDGSVIYSFYNWFG